MRRILLIILFATCIISGKCVSSPLEHQIDEAADETNVVGVLQSNEEKRSIHNTETKQKSGHLRSLYGNYYWNRNGYNNYNYNNNYNNNRGSTFVQAIANFFLVIILLAVGFFIWTFCGCTALCCGATGAASAYSYNNYYNDYFNASAPQAPGTMQQNNNSGNGNNNLRSFGNTTTTTYYGNNSQQSFSQIVQQVKRDVENTMVTLNQSKVQPFSGKYNASYLDSQSNIRNATVCLFFTPDPQRQGFTIAGEGNDNNGYSVVEEGFAKYDGSCWWIEKKISGNAGGTQFLSRGKFHYGQKAFEGTWIESTLQSGQYLSFTAA